MSVQIKGAAGRDFDYRGGGLLIDLDAKLAIVDGDGLVTCMPDKSRSSAPKGVDVLEGAGSFSTDATLDSFVVEEGQQGSAVVVGRALLLTDTSIAPPVLTVPGAQSATEDTTKSITGISVAYEGDTLRVDLAVSHGGFTLASVAGLAFSLGDGTDDSHCTFTGTVASVNTALAAIAYLAAANYNGGDSLAISVVDPDFESNADSDSVAITVASVNDVPVLTVPGSQSVNEDTLLTINGTSVADVDAVTITAGLSCSHGTLDFTTRTGLTLNSGAYDSAALNVTGAIAAVNTALGSIEYLGAANYSGSDSIAIAISDGAGGTDSGAIGVTVGAVNDAPVVTVPGTQSGTEDTLKSVTGVSIADVDDSSMKCRAQQTHGTVDLASHTGLTVFAGAYGSADVTVTGTLSAINAALAAGLQITPTANFAGAAVTTVTATDAATATHSQSFTTNFAAVNDAPTITPPGNQTIDQDTDTGDLAVTVGDVETSAGSLTLTGTSSNHTVVPDANITFGGSGASRTVKVTPAAGQSGGPVTITLRVDDGTTHTDATFTVTVTFVGSLTIDYQGGADPIEVDVPEGDTIVAVISASGNTGALVWSLSADGDHPTELSLFAIDASTGQLTFVSPATLADDDDADGTYHVVVDVADDLNTDSRHIVATVSTLVAPTITSNGGDSTASVTVTEGGSVVVTTVTATGSGPLAYGFGGSGSEGGDESSFTIDADTGVLTGIGLDADCDPNLKNGLGSSNTSSTYLVEVGVTGPGGTDTQMITVTVNPVAFTAAAEKWKYTALDPSAGDTFGQVGDDGARICANKSDSQGTDKDAFLDGLIPADENLQCIRWQDDVTHRYIDIIAGHSNDEGSFYSFWSANAFYYDGGWTHWKQDRRIFPSNVNNDIQNVTFNAAGPVPSTPADGETLSFDYRGHTFGPYTAADGIGFSGSLGTIQADMDAQFPSNVLVLALDGTRLDFATYGDDVLIVTATMTTDYSGGDSLTADVTHVQVGG